MKKNNILITSIIISIILLIIVIIFLKILNNDRNKFTEQFTDIREKEINRTLKLTSNRNNYYIVKKCIDKFYIYYSTIYNSREDFSTKEIYNMLDKKYIQAREITEDNLLNKLKGVSSSKVSITKMYECEQSENISIYFVYGTLRDVETSDISEFAIMIKLDKYNKTFSIFLQDYIEEKYSDIKIGENIKFSYADIIEPNDDNRYSYESIDEETYITDIFDNFRDNIIYNKQLAYESLDEEYRAKRFSTFEVFEEYIQNNARRILTMKLSIYKKTKSDDGVQYICEDTKNNYYLINEISTMNCTFILDTYTIDLPEFIEKYEESDDREKVALNIEKIKEAINAKDFEYVYNKTDETFINNNFQNYSNFENYLKSKLFEENTFEYKKIEQTTNVYRATVIVKNKKNTNAEAKEIKIIMKLTDTTDYWISFSFE